MRHSSVCIAAILAAFLTAGQGNGQSVTTSVPSQVLGSSFFEQSGVQWSVQGPNFFAQFGGGAPAVPFGNPGGAPALQTGAGFHAGGVRGSIGLSMTQGSNRSITSTTPSITTMNGAGGNISAQTLQPFVTGFTPVLAGGAYGSPVQQNASSNLFRSGQQAQANELAARAQANRNAQQQLAVQALQRAERAELEGNLRMARANYRKALAADQGPLRAQILTRLRQHGW
ncbi:hypothetical protein FYK55_09375 [Roseiconus nitratireducens]|uniref:Tetratricopeptide repeat protein n=1 Tax=Roseiconus nitratireducens TaxID=2605748 RepID=A0A5M6DAW8_9BACT|nr:hypothetical protein [Roseiconus nitratireducens]KAA5544523.1 hypothetical protein FYK55_09375 [Roseiconus nitratireducens]